MIVASPSSLYSDLDVRVELNAPLAERTWYRAGGCADALVHPRSEEERSGTPPHRSAALGVRGRPHPPPPDQPRIRLY